ncbi:MAG: response regulator transcription factor, partial [Actinobacteria bacterium]|nr:response regulator transcription factor [Actinomycetota bacterium]
MQEPSVVVAAGDGVDGAILVGVLRRHGFEVHIADEWVTSTSGTPCEADVALVDTELAGGDPLTLVRELRRAGVPTAVVGGRGPEERAAAEAEGADAFLVRPVVATHLLTTLRALARRPAVDVVLRSGPLRIDVGARAVQVGERRVHLAPREFDLLVYLARSPGRVFPTPRLLRDVW